MAALVLVLYGLATPQPTVAYQPYENLDSATKNQVRWLWRYMGPYEAAPPVNEAPADRQGAARAYHEIIRRNPATAPNGPARGAYIDLQREATSASHQLKTRPDWRYDKLSPKRWVRGAGWIGTAAAGYTLGYGIGRKFFQLGVPDGPTPGGDVTEFQLWPINADSFSPWGGEEDGFTSPLGENGFFAQWKWENRGNGWWQVYNEQLTGCQGQDVSDARPGDFGTRVVSAAFPTPQLFCGYDQFGQEIIHDGTKAGLFAPITITNGIYSWPEGQPKPDGWPTGEPAPNIDGHFDALPPWQDPTPDGVVDTIINNYFDGAGDKGDDFFDFVITQVTGAPGPDPFAGMEFIDFEEHFGDHGHQFPEYGDPWEYKQGAVDVVERGDRDPNGSEGVLRCERTTDEGVALLYWDIERGAFVVVKDGKIVTFYKPEPGFEYWQSQCD